MVEFLPHHPMTDHFHHFQGEGGGVDWRRGTPPSPDGPILPPPGPLWGNSTYVSLCLVNPSSLQFESIQSNQIQIRPLIWHTLHSRRNWTGETLFFFFFSKKTSIESKFIKRNRISGTFVLIKHERVKQNCNGKLPLPKRLLEDDFSWWNDLMQQHWQQWDL